MILEFKTKRNANGHREYLGIDTNAEIYARQNRYMIPPGIEIKSSDMKELIKQCERNEFKEVDFIY
jgi:hypothetical protein